MARRGKRSNSTVPIMLMIAFLIAILIGLAVLLSPERELPPPPSAMTYEARPTATPSTPDAPGDTPITPETPVPTLLPAMNTPDEPAEPEVVEGRYRITGLVVDKNTQAPIANVHLVASRIPTEEEEAAFNERDTQFDQYNDSKAIDALINERQRLWADARGNTDNQGTFQIPVSHAGKYKITVQAQSHVDTTIDPQFVGETAPEWNLTIALEVGASIAGRVFDGFNNQGISGIAVYANLEDGHERPQAVSDDEGNYLITGLGVGNYAVIAEIEQTAYRVTKELPYKRTSIGQPEQKITDIDFKLDRGGVVWGYVTTPDKEPIAADVVLCTSDSVLSQALSAMVRKAPPLNTNSNDDDGYYEIVGIPLNEPWRLYATAKENAPQLAEAFVLTDREKEARVDIFMFTGSNVFGQVINKKGEGVPDAQLVCIPGFGQLLAPMDSPQVFRETNSDDQGYFEIREVPAGDYQIMAQKTGYKYALRGEPFYSNGYKDVENIRVVLEDIEAGRYAVFGTVRDAQGNGLSGAAVSLSGLGTESLQGVGRDTTTGGGGEFRFDGVEIGTYVLRAEYEGYSPKTLGRVLLDEPNTIVMRASALVRGRVLAKSTGRAPENGYTLRASLLEGADVDQSENTSGILSLIESAGSPAHENHFEDPQGTYEISIEAGTWQIEASAPSLTPKRQTITVQAGEVVEKIDFLLTEDGGVISGRVTVADGSSPQGTMVSLVEASSAAQALSSIAAGVNGDLPSQHVDEEGTFSFKQLPEGSYNILARHPAYPQAMSETVVLEAEGNATGVEVRLGPGGTLEGYVYRNGGPVTGTVVTLVAAGSPYTGTSDSQGYYEIRNIPAGEYEAFAGDASGVMVGDSIGGQGYPVIIADGLVTRQNFGDTNGIAIEVTVVGRRGFLAATLNPPGAPVFQGDAEMSQLSGYRSYVYGDVIRFEDIPLGDWQLDLYAGSGLSSTLNWVGTELVSVTGEAPSMSIVVGAQ